VTTTVSNGPDRTNALQNGIVGKGGELEVRFLYQEVLRLALAANVSKPPSLSNVAHGPKRTLTTLTLYCGAARRSGHWCMVQHFC
jgi:hypothetical protein